IEEDQSVRIVELGRHVDIAACPNKVLIKIDQVELLRISLRIPSAREHPLTLQEEFAPTGALINAAYRVILNVGALLADKEARGRRRRKIAAIPRDDVASIAKVNGVKEPQ